MVEELLNNDTTSSYRFVPPQSFIYDYPASTEFDSTCIDTVGWFDYTSHPD